MKKKELIGLSINTGTYTEFIEHLLCLAEVRESNYTCVANVHMLIEGYNDPFFANIVNSAIMITPDGRPLTWALRLLYGLKQERVAGMDLLPDLLQRATVKKLSVYFYGGTEELLERAHCFMQQEYPLLELAGFYSPPFRKLTLEEESSVVENINSSGANLVFVVLGCPKQEKWMASMKGRINSVMIGIGGALPVMIGVQKRAPKWMQDVSLEWLYRLMQEPRRLSKRYAYTNSLFLYLFFVEFIKVRILRKTA